MSTKENDKTGDAILQKWLADLQQQQQQRHEAEGKRRAALTPEQRAAEDRGKAAQAAQIERQKVTQKFAAIGEAVRKADTWTIADFCWLLLAENPEDPGSWGFFDERSSKAIKQHRQYCAILESCVPTRLEPVNSVDASAKRRFTVQSLVQVARDKRLGCVDVLAEVIGLKHQPSVPTAPAPLPADRKPLQAPATDVVAAHGPTPRSSHPVKPRAHWYSVLNEVLLQIESGAKRLGRPLMRDSLPDGVKYLLPIVQEACEQQKAKPPSKADTLQKQVNVLGWGFGGPGVRGATGELRRLFEAGDKKTPPA